MALLDPVEDNAGLATLLLGMYLSNAVFALPWVDAAFYDLPRQIGAGVFYVTGPLLAAYVLYKVYRESTHFLWDFVSKGVVALSLFLLVAMTVSYNPGIYGSEVERPSVGVVAVLLAPAATLVAFVVVRESYLYVVERESEGPPA